MDNPVQILKKTIKDFEKKKSHLEKEIIDVDNSIEGIKKIIDDMGVQKTHYKSKLKQKKIIRSKITETMVRDAVVYLGKNPPDTSSNMFPLNQGYFTQPYIVEQMGYRRGLSIKKYLDKLVSKDILEEKNYKRGKQYRYIDPAETGPGKDFKSELKEISNDFSRSNPIPGTGNNKLTIRNKDVEKMISKAKEEGFSVERLGSDHLRVAKTGSTSSATISTTGRDIARYVENCRSDLRRIGVEI